MDLTHLGKQSQDPVDRVEIVPWSGSPVRVTLSCSEFTSHCPVTRQPDFARFTIEYIAKDGIVETKSMKLYLWQFRDRAEFNERLTESIAADLYDQIDPYAIRVTGQFNPRGGISVTAVCSYGEVDKL